MKKYLLIAGIILLAGCIKKKGQYIHINGDMQAAYYFKQGSYWIYTDSISGQTDSFYVTMNENGTSSTTPHNPSEAVHSDVLKTIIGRKTITPATTATDTTGLMIGLESNVFTFTYTQYNYNKYPDIPAHELMFQLYYPFPAGSAYNPDDTTFTNVYGSYVISGSNFPNVTQVHHYANLNRSWLNAPYLHYDDYIYLSPGIGVVKMVLNHPLDSNYKVWELQRYKIVQ